jgi:large subunit ribosomal protein L4
MPKLNVYTSKGTKSKAVDMPKSWKEKENKILLAQAIRVYEARSHPGLSKVKTRGEVSYSTRKIYRQKGTGRARHGDRGAPIFVGGGVTHGPKGIKRVLTFPKKMRKKALKVALNLKMKEGILLLVTNISSLKKTKEAASLIDKIASKEKKFNGDSRFTFALSEKNKNAQLALRNINNVEVIPFRDLNAYKVFHGGVLVVDKEVLDEQKSGVKAAKSVGTKTRKTPKKT